MYYLDSSHIWHVAKSGNDGNSGHAGQYPVNLANNAKPTIGAAVAAASSGDTIIIWPGTYTEQVNLDGANKSLTLIGTNRDLCIITWTDDVIHVETNTQIHNLSVVTTTPNKSGIHTAGGGGQHNIIINNCYCYAQQGAIYLSSITNVRILNTYIKSTVNPVMISGCSNLLMDNCFIEATGEVAGSEIICMTYGASGLGAIVRNTGIIGKTTVASCTNLIGLKCGAGQIMFENCSFNLNAAQTPTGYVAAISNATSPPTAYPRILMKNCNVYVNSGIAATYGIYLTKGEAYITDSLIMTPAAGNSLKQVDPGILQVAGCRYDETTVSGSIIITPSNVDKFNGSEDDVLRLNKATKLLTNKAIQNKSSGIIDYYDDDGETVILTHTPADGESTIERTPS